MNPNENVPTADNRPIRWRQLWRFVLRENNYGDAIMAFNFGFGGIVVPTEYTVRSWMTPRRQRWHAVRLTSYDGVPLRWRDLVPMIGDHGNDCVAIASGFGPEYTIRGISHGIIEGEQFIVRLQLHL